MRELIKKLRGKNSKASKNISYELYDFIEQMAWDLYSFIFRHEIESLPKLGSLGEWLAQMAYKDLRMFEINLKQRKIDDSEWKRRSKGRFSMGSSQVSMVSDEHNVTTDVLFDKPKPF